MPSNFDITKFAKEISEEIIKNCSEDNIDLEKVCYDKLKKLFPRLSTFELTDKSLILLKKIRILIERYIDNCKEQGIKPAYEFNNYPQNLLIRYSVKYKEDLWVSELRRHKKVLVQAVDRLSWQDFENLCKFILQKKGIFPIQLTRRNQEGFDFCGLFNISNYIPFIPPNFRVRVIGQVKHYSKNVAPPVVRSFHTYSLSIQRGEKVVVKNLPRWFLSTRSPFISIFMTKSGFTQSAVAFAENEWIILKKGEQIIEDIINLPEAKDWFCYNKKNELCFNLGKFRSSFKQT